MDQSAASKESSQKGMHRVASQKARSSQFVCDDDLANRASQRVCCFSCGRAPEDVSDSRKYGSVLSNRDTIREPSKKSVFLKSSGVQDFDFGQTIAHGRFGRIRRADVNDASVLKDIDLSNVGPLCVKVLYKRELVDERQVDHVKNERKIHSHCRHEFITRLYATLQDPDKIYFLMEFTEGESLFRSMRRERKFSSDASRFYAAEVVCVLEYLRGKKIAYRDLKPENIILDLEGHIKVIDFGFAKRIEDGEKTFTACGTPHYMAPEILSKEGHTWLVDWWALGVFIYECLLGKPPFDGIDARTIYGKIQRNTPNLAGLEENEKEIITALLCTDVAERAGSGEDGGKDVKVFAFFESINWQDVPKRLMTPPFVPASDVIPENEAAAAAKICKEVRTSAQIGSVKDDEQLLFEDVCGSQKLDKADPNKKEPSWLQKTFQRIMPGQSSGPAKQAW